MNMYETFKMPYLWGEEKYWSFTYFQNTTWDWVGPSEKYKICWVWRAGICVWWCSKNLAVWIVWGLWVGRHWGLGIKEGHEFSSLLFNGTFGRIFALFLSVYFILEAEWQGHPCFSGARRWFASAPAASLSLCQLCIWIKSQWSLCCSSMWKEQQKKGQREYSTPGIVIQLAIISLIRYSNLY